MKKTLVAIAALAATSAFAQSSVTMSGRIDAGMGSRVDTAATGVKTNVSSIAHNGINTSFLALKGTEDLGGGLNAGFYVETGLLGADANKIGDRGSFLTLTGGFGEIKAGVQNSGARDMFIAYDAGGAINVAGSLNSSTGADAGGVGSHTAFATAVKYTAPTYKGLTVAGSFTKNNTNYSDTAADTRTGQGYSFGGNYVNGPLSLGLSYANGVTTTVTTAGTSPSLSGDITAKTTVVGGSYDLGMAKLYVAHFKLDQADVVDTASTTTNVQRKSTTYGVRAPLSAKLTAFASMGTGTLQKGATTAFTGDMKATQLGVNYDFSKRTAVKAAYGTTKTEATATTETKVKETAVALVHLF